MSESDVARLEAERLRGTTEIAHSRHARDLDDLNEIIRLLASMLLPGWRRGDPT